MTCHRVPTFLPPALGHYAGQTAPRHNEEQATGVHWLRWTAAPSTPPETPIIDQLILKSVNTMQKSMRRGRGSGRAAHLPLVTFRPPQAASLSVKIGNEVGGTEGREPSLHMDASASILRPLSPYGPDRRGLPLFPRLSALRCCSSSVRRGILCCGIGGQRARQPFGTTTAASESGAG